MQLFQRFKDFDRVNNGFVSQNQFQRVLDDLNLFPQLTVNEIRALIKLFSACVGFRDEINYASFCDGVNELCSFEFRNLTTSGRSNEANNNSNDANRRDE
jgi:hypothetical protein